MTMRTLIPAATVCAAAALLIGPPLALAQDDVAPPSVVQLCAATDIQAVDSLLGAVANSDLVGTLSPLASLVVPSNPDGVVVRAGVELDDVRTALDCASTSEPTPTATPAPTTEVPVDPLYPDCAAAIAAGVAPIVRGEDGYRAGLDQDGDGVACEANEGPATPTPSATSSAPSTGGFSQLDAVPSKAAETGGGPA